MNLINQHIIYFMYFVHIQNIEYIEHIESMSTTGADNTKDTSAGHIVKTNDGQETLPTPSLANNKQCLTVFNWLGVIHQNLFDHTITLSFDFIE